MCFHVGDNVVVSYASLISSPSVPYLIAFIPLSLSPSPLTFPSLRASINSLHLFYPSPSSSR